MTAKSEKKSEKDCKSYEEMSDRLDEIMAELTGASVPLERMISLYTEGMQLAESCKEILNSYMGKIEELSKTGKVKLIGEKEGDKND